MRVGLRISLIAMWFVVAASFSLAAEQAKSAEAPQAAPSGTRDSLAGMYDGGQMEVAAALLLKPDGHFKYQLAYGALDEAAEGTWESKNGAVFLTTVPAVKPPEFVVESDSPEAGGGLWIKVSNGPLMQGAAQRVYLIYGSNEPAEMAQADEDGHVAFPDNRRPKAIIPKIPVYPILLKPIPLTGTGGHRIVMRFEPNDIGKADFRAQRLSIESGVLVMPRRDLELMLRFRRQR
jgi:hypothetical protein